MTAPLGEQVAPPAEGATGRPARRSTRARTGRWTLGVAVVLVGLAAVVTATSQAVDGPLPLGVIPACEQLADDLADAGSFLALTTSTPREFARVAGRYRAALGGSWDSGVGSLLDAAALGGRSDRRVATLAALDWCLSAGWVPARS